MSEPRTETYPLLWSNDVDAIAQWAVESLGLTERWRASNDDGVVEHAEVDWHGSRISLNVHGLRAARATPSLSRVAGDSNGRGV